ncbi:hypothetical protein D3C73_1168760 [compost metagenome]
MARVRDDAIGGFNTFLKNQQALGGNARLTLVLFDDRYLVPVENTPILEVPLLDEETYAPLGWTAMNDAIGRALTSLEAKNPAKAIITILTDGAENASKEYTAAQVKEKIKAAEDRGWEVIFLAANIDAFTAGTTLGISACNTLQFSANASGFHDAFACMDVRASSYRSN